MDLPSYITENADRSLTVKLTRAYSFDGVERDTMTLREPTAGDQKRFITSDKASPREIADIEGKMMASLADGVSPAALDALAVRDYKRVSQAIIFFHDSQDET